ncbi:abcC3 [Symbiodinium microadriaticum]|nr:abcC3 [Symbiodinium microadriaticum]
MAMPSAASSSEALELPIPGTVAAVAAVAVPPPECRSVSSPFAALQRCGIPTSPISPQPLRSLRAMKDAATFLSRYTFWWVFPSIRAANRRARLAQEDLPKLPRVDDPEFLFSKVFLYSVLHGWTFLFFMTIDPLMLNAVQDSGSTEVSFPVQLCLVGALSLSMLVRVTCMEICFFASVRVQNNVRSVLVHAIFRKSLCVPDHELDVGRISNLMATDADKIGKWSSLLFSLSQWSWTFASLPFLVYFLYQLVVQECRDHRASLMSEMVRGIRTVKLQAIVRVRILGAFNTLVGSVLSVMVPVSIFAWYTVVRGERLDAATAFTTLAWISTLQWSVQALPGIYRAVANLKPSFDRIDRFLTTPITTPQASFLESDVDVRPWHEEPWLSASSFQGLAACTGIAVDVQNAAFGYRHWDANANLQETCILEQVSFQVPKGSFVMIAGPVGSGKSTLLASLACSRPPLRGQCHVSGHRAFVSQKPFLLNGTVKENILFGLPLDEDKYASALRMAALVEDLSSLSSGDATPVGESGVQLSGGQKARVALARAVYSNSEVVCLDDVLSAVDAHTARYIWDSCLIEGLLRNKKTVILVSHQIQYLSRPEVDSVIMLRNGQLWLHGPWSELAKSGDVFLRLVQEWDIAESEEALSRQSSSSSLSETLERERNADELISLAECQSAVGSVLGALEGRRIDAALIRSVRETLNGSADLQTDLIREGIHSDMLCKAGPSCFYLYRYTAHLLLKKALQVLSAPMSFFDSSPTGRILNRFLQDVQNIDNFLPDSISDQIMKTLTIVTQLSLVYIEAPWVLCSLPILAVPYSMIYKRMRIPNRDSRRLESAARSPVYTHFGDTLHGRETVRAFAAEARFEKENLRHISTMAQGLYGNQAVGKWAQELQLDGAVCVCACAPRMGAADVETKFVSVERVAEYLRLEEESCRNEGDEEASAMLGTAWPSQGEVRLEAVTMRYRLHRALVLKGVDLFIPGKAKLSFCGRTGCGKSSLFSVLNRLYPLASGRVLIDGVDISQLSLQTLRMSIRVVSQEAFLLSGSLRQNLTMGSSEHDDEVLWHCLSAVGLAEKVRLLPGSLDFRVDIAGGNFSVGERQLLTLARVLVPSIPCSLEDWAPPRMLLCDEATANIDVLTDEKVHQVVLEMDATVMMICRMAALVVVLDAGLVVEQGSPEELLDSDRHDVHRVPAQHVADLMRVSPPGCMPGVPSVLAELHEPSSRAKGPTPSSPSSPMSPMTALGLLRSQRSPGKRIRRNAAMLGIPLDLRGTQFSLPVPVRHPTGVILAPSPGPRVSRSSAQGAALRAFAALAAAPSAAQSGQLPLHKVVRGGGA